jgi:hypothetical protein
MIAIPLDLEQQVLQFAQIEHLDPVSFLKRVIANYLASQDEETMYLHGIESSLAEEWSDDEDEVNFRDL